MTGTVCQKLESRDKFALNLLSSHLRCYMCCVLQVIVPMWISALYHAVDYAGSQFGSTRMWQQYGAKLQHILSAYQVCQAGHRTYHVSPTRRRFLP